MRQVVKMDFGWSDRTNLTTQAQHEAAAIIDANRADLGMDAEQARCCPSQSFGLRAERVQESERTSMDSRPDP